MAVPKRKTSHARQASRRANWKLTAPNVAECPQCHQPKLSHRVCPHCGQYEGRTVLELEKADKAAK
ncbi:MAG: 50S ribosomal protein L32 [Symbiobacteriia bacterium]